MAISGPCDVLVLGGGNAALCAALEARRAGARVALAESAPRPLRGGNSRHTRNLRTMHAAPGDGLTGSYPEEEYWADLAKVTRGRTDERLARMAIRGSWTSREWMKAQGARFQPSLGGTLQLSRTNSFFLGGGKALVNAYYACAEALGVDIAYDTEAVDLALDGTNFLFARLRQGNREFEMRAKALVVATGGFESNLEWLREAWGEAADNFLIRGTPYNKGRMLRALLDKGAQSIGEPTQGHCVAIDARAPKFDGGIVTRVDCVSLGIVVNAQARRFYDEGEDFWPKRYAIWGRLVAGQPGQIAYAIIDAKAMGRFMPPVYPPLRADSLRALAPQLGLDGESLEATVVAFNAGVRGEAFDHTVLDGCHTEGVAPAKTHWARRIDRPPFFAYPLRPGLTFTYLGVKVDAQARIVFAEGPSSSLFAAGEIMAGNILGEGYLAGIGMSIGTVFGRIAGTEAARHARA